MGEYDKAIADCSAALKLEPRRALCLYARGVAELDLKEKDKGEADIAAATAIAPRVARLAKAQGLSPPP
jgi:tetratricopeptide (TPR) repeat protein